MTGPIRRLATVIFALFGLLLLQLNLTHLWEVDLLNPTAGVPLANHPDNARLLEQEHSIERGRILVADQVIVRSEPTEGRLKYLREYLEPELYAHVTGFYSPVVDRSGVEAAMNQQLTGTSPSALAENLSALLIGRDDRGNHVRLTLRPEIQEAARDALNGRDGSVVALDPRTGEVLASYSNPSFNPNLLASHNLGEVQQAWAGLNEDDANPMLDRVTREHYPPGSTFKLLVAAAAFEAGNDPTMAVNNLSVYSHEQTDHEVQNFTRGAPCVTGAGASVELIDAFAVSCNTAFASLAAEELGIERLVETAEAFGFNRQVPYELNVVQSGFANDQDGPTLAQSAIGQRDVRWTPMHAALVVAAVANDGNMVEPHVVKEVLDPASRVLENTLSRPWRDASGRSRAVSTKTAEDLREMMVEVVTRGTAANAFAGSPLLSQHVVGGKTGTDETGYGARDSDAATGWFIGFVDDRLAVAVVMPGGGPGGGSAANVARNVMETAMGLR